MALNLVSDNGQLATIQREDGSIIQVPSSRIGELGLAGPNADQTQALMDVNVGGATVPEAVVMPGGDMAPGSNVAAATSVPILDPLNPGHVPPMIPEGPLATQDSGMNAPTDPGWTPTGPAAPQPPTSSGSPSEGSTPSGQGNPPPGAGRPQTSRPGTIREGNDAVYDAYDRQSQAQKDLTDAQVRQNDALAEERERQRIQEEEFEKQKKAELEEQQATVEAAETREKQLQEEYENFEFESLWEKQSGGQNALAIIGLALGALGQAMSGGQIKNQALPIFMNSIDRNIELQTKELEKLGKNVDMASNIVAREYQKVGDMRVAQANARAVMLDGFNRKLEDVVQNTKSDILKNNGKVLQSQIDIEKNKSIVDGVKIERQERRADRADRRAERQLRLQERSFEEQKRAREAAEKARREDEANQPDYIDTEKVEGAVLPDGSTARVKDAKDREAIRERTVATQIRIDAARRIAYILSDKGREALGLSKVEAQQEAARLAAALLADAKGTPSDRDLQIYLGGVGINMEDPTDWASIRLASTDAKALEKYIEAEKHYTNTFLKGYNKDLKFQEFNTRPDPANKIPNKEPSRDDLKTQARTARTPADRRAAVEKLLKTDPKKTDFTITLEQGKDLIPLLKDMYDRETDPMLKKHLATRLAQVTTKVRVLQDKQKKKNLDRAKTQERENQKYRDSHIPR